MIGLTQEMRLRVSDAGANVALDVAGSPGVHQIQSNNDLSGRERNVATNIFRPKESYPSSSTRMPPLLVASLHGASGLARGGNHPGRGGPSEDFDLVQTPSEAYGPIRVEKLSLLT